MRRQLRCSIAYFAEYISPSRTLGGVVLQPPELGERAETPLRLAAPVPGMLPQVSSGICQYSHTPASKS
jgi:hypothetical protein